MIFEAFITNRNYLHFDRAQRQFELHIQTPVFSNQMMFAERDPRGDERESGRIEIHGMAIHAANSSCPVETSCRRGQGKAKRQAYPLALLTAAVAEILPQT